MLETFLTPKIDCNRLLSMEPCCGKRNKNEKLYRNTKRSTRIEADKRLQSILSLGNTSQSHFGFKKKIKFIVFIGNHQII